VALGPKNVWASGASNFYQPITNGFKSSFPKVMLLHWNGLRWSLTSAPPTQMFDGPSRLTATSDGTAWATGNCYFDNVVLRWNGKRWTRSTGPMLKRLAISSGSLGAPRPGSCLR
jgi:hypothetical protein